MGAVLIGAQLIPADAIAEALGLPHQRHAT